MASKIKVIEKNEGKKIEWEQSGPRLYFGDDELMLNTAKYQKDWPVSVDVCKDRAGNLTIGTESALRYVAQVEIPAAQYNDDVKNQEKLPIDMGDVTLTLWSIE